MRTPVLRSGVPWLTTLGAVLVSVALGSAGEWQSLSPGAAGLIQQYAARAAKGDYVGGSESYDALRREGMSDAEISKFQEQLWKRTEKAQREQDKQREKEGKDKSEPPDEFERQRDKDQAERDRNAKDQNRDISDDWHLGGIYRDRDYKLAMSVTNNCVIPQDVRIDYPKAFLLDGPKIVTVPPKTTIDVPMTLTMTKPPMPLPPYPPGLSPSCYDLHDKLALLHQQTERTMGDVIYTCLQAYRFYRIGLHIHQHGPPDPSGGGGGGVKPNSTCEIYWKTGEFFPGPIKRSPEDCVYEIRALAKEYFGPNLTKARQANPTAWTWVPTAAQIDQMTVAALMALKARAEDQAAPRYFG